MDINKMGEWLRLFFADPIDGWYSPQYNQDKLNWTRNNSDYNWVHHDVELRDPNKVIDMRQPFLTEYDDWRKVKVYPSDVAHNDKEFQNIRVAPRHIHPDDSKYKSMAKMFAGKVGLPIIGGVAKSPAFLIPYLLNKTAQPAY